MNPIFLSYGGGTNSTGLLVEANKRKIRPDVIVFSDTGDERPETYAYITLFSEWLVAHDFPPIDIIRWIRKDGTFVPLGQWCLEHKTLPSKAFGMSGCTSKWKQQPLDKFVKKHDIAKAAWDSGNLVERWIGYDADEPQRAKRMFEKNPDPHLWSWRAPLIEWGFGRDECLKVIAEAGLPQPGKSSCYFCPSMRKHEIEALPSNLQIKALEIEDNAVLTSCKGLGRSFSWRSLLEKKTTACEVVDQDCGCYDGESV